MKTKATILILLTGLLSCSKDKIVVVSNNLTDCPANSTCTYQYFDNADFQNWNQPVLGQYRVFWYKSVNTNICDATSEFYFKTSMSNSDFDIKSSQIATGQILANNFECPCCDYAVLTKPIGGEIKGKKADATHWLINASIIFGIAPNHPTDTLVVNQYFTSEKLP